MMEGGEERGRMGFVDDEKKIGAFFSSHGRKREGRDLLLWPD
jgi:hypothetical protein